MLALPGAVRAHHQLNLVPFAHILVACGVDVAWRRAGAQRAAVALRGVVAVALAALTLGNLRVIRETAHEIDLSGGRGRFTSALGALARELDASPGSAAVSSSRTARISPASRASGTIFSRAARVAAIPSSSARSSSIRQRAPWCERITREACSPSARS